MPPADARRQPSRGARLRSAVLVALGTGALALALATLLWPEPSAPPPPPGGAVLPAAEESGGTASVAPPPSPVPAPLPARLAIPRIGVDAPLTVRGIGPDGVMENPLGPQDVAWYDFTARPGEGGNAVFSGHVDYRNYGPAVFADLKDLRTGDLVEVYGVDGSALFYQVTALASYKAESAPAADILADTGRDMLTLITCAGTFRGRGQGYSDRLVVRAERL